jgi:hypothetical protein
VMLFGSATDELASALDVLDGTKPRLSDRASPLAGPSPAGALLELRLTGLSTVRLPVESPIIKRIEMLGLTTGESDQVSYLTVKLEANDVETAEEVKATIDNALNSALSATEDYELSELINAVHVTRHAKAVTVDVRGPAELGWHFLEKLAAKAVELGKARLAGQKKQ